MKILHKKRFLVLNLLLALMAANSLFHPGAIAKEEEAIFEDDLTTTSGLRWGGGRKLPFKKAVDIREGLINTPVGKVVADRFSKQAAAGAIYDLFGSSPYPEDQFLISLWGSKIEGCFVEMIVQFAPPGGEVDISAMVPKLLELGLGTQAVQLPPQTTVEPKLFKQDYSYNSSSGGITRTYNSTWYMSRNLFVIDSQIADLLRNAPPAEARARLTFVNGETKLFPIKKETVAGWKSAYGFNPTCRSTSAQAPAPYFAQQPLLSTSPP
jgi:hypothetical protein